MFVKTLPSLLQIHYYYYYLLIYLRFKKNKLSFEKSCIFYYLKTAESAPAMDVILKLAAQYMMDTGSFLYTTVAV